jgi:hypothetical protein
MYNTEERITIRIMLKCKINEKVLKDVRKIKEQNNKKM